MGRRATKGRIGGRRSKPSAPSFDPWSEMESLQTLRRQPTSLGKWIDLLKHRDVPWYWARDYVVRAQDLVQETAWRLFSGLSDDGRKPIDRGRRWGLEKLKDEEEWRKDPIVLSAETEMGVVDRKPPQSAGIGPLRRSSAAGFP
ncbi:MAG: hypothetical protein HYT87_05495 [Nitrospirae bacterium]|nr:hypothetical protein [Nitrospirota bacterium]